MDRKGKILVVDDEPDLIEVTRLRLERRYLVVTAFDGLDALEKVEIERPDLIILDLMMPRMDGVEFVHRLRGEAAMTVRRTPVLVVSARTDMRDAFEDGQINGFLTKPYESRELLERVEEAFARRN